MVIFCKVQQLMKFKILKQEKINISPKIEMPKCSEIYISTKTRTCELNSTIDLYEYILEIKYY